MTEETAIVPFGRRAAPCFMSSSKEPFRLRHLFISCLAPASSAGFPVKMIGSPEIVVTVTDLFSGSLCAVDVLVVLMIE